MQRFPRFICRTQQVPPQRRWVKIKHIHKMHKCVKEQAIPISEAVLDGVQCTLLLITVAKEAASISKGTMGNLWPLPDYKMWLWGILCDTATGLFIKMPGGVKPKWCYWLSRTWAKMCRNPKMGEHASGKIYFFWGGEAVILKLLNRILKSCSCSSLGSYFCTSTFIICRNTETKHAVPYRDFPSPSWFTPFPTTLALFCKQLANSVYLAPLHLYFIPDYVLCKK